MVFTVVCIIKETIDKETTPLEFLKIKIRDSFIYCERNYPGNRDKFKIRLKGMESWTYPEEIISL